MFHESAALFVRLSCYAAIPEQLQNCGRLVGKDGLSKFAAARRSDTAEQRLSCKAVVERIQPDSGIVQLVDVVAEYSKPCKG